MAKSKKPGKSGAKGKDNNHNNNDTGKSGKGSKSSHGKKHKSRMMDVSGDDYKFRKSLEAGKSILLPGANFGIFRYSYSHLFC